MPSKRSQPSGDSLGDSLGHEERIALALKAIETKEIPSSRKAASVYNVAESTLRARRNGVKSRADCRANCHKLTETEEKTLERLILSLDNRGAAPRAGAVREMANILLQARGDDPVQTVGDKWAYNFVQRHPELSKRLSKPHNSDRAKGADSAKQTTASRAANKQQQKRPQPNGQIPHIGVISVQVLGQILGSPQDRTRVERRCGICRNPGHRRDRCPDRAMSFPDDIDGVMVLDEPWELA